MIPTRLTRRFNIQHPILRALTAAEIIATTMAEAEAALKSGAALVR
jgi:hypothetical protein